MAAKYICKLVICLKEMMKYGNGSRMKVMDMNMKGNISKKTQRRTNVKEQRPRLYIASLRGGMKYFNQLFIKN